MTTMMTARDETATTDRDGCMDGSEDEDRRRLLSAIIGHEDLIIFSHIVERTS